MLGVEAFPSLLFLILVFFIPESPRWLIAVKNRMEEARQILSNIDPLNSEEMIESIKGTDLQPGRRTGVRTFFSRRYKVPILLAFLFAFFNHVSGINAIIYFAPRVFNLTGMGNEAALLSSVGIGVVNLLFTMLGLLLIDKYGRRKLMFIGSVGSLFSLSLISSFFYAHNFFVVTR